MVFSSLYKKLRFLPLIALPFLVWLLPPALDTGTSTISPEKINLALRRTADGLLRLSGDSTTRIPAIEQTGVEAWKVRLEQPFDYDKLPALLQASLDLYGIKRQYEVAVRRCDDNVIDLGYHQLDLLQGSNLLKKEQTPSTDTTQDITVPCGGRDMPDGCHFIEVTFLKLEHTRFAWMNKSAVLLVILGGFLGFYFFKRQNKSSVVPAEGAEADWVSFGNSRLDVAGQVVICGGVRQTLTFRETKLLHLFVVSPDRLLSRDFILREVWADEGVLVGRSVDVFLSRLRKKLATDPSVGIVAVHGVGYRLETGKLG